VDTSLTIECALLARTDLERTVRNALLVVVPCAMMNSSSATANASTADLSQDAKMTRAHKQDALHVKKDTTWTKEDAILVAQQSQGASSADHQTSVQNVLVIS